VLIKGSFGGFILPLPRAVLYLSSMTSKGTYNNHKNRYNAKAKQSNKVLASNINVLLRQFYKQTHPDILRSSNSQYADSNSDSMQVLNGILTTIKGVNQYPQRMYTEIPFFVKSNDGTINKVSLVIRTAGGDCRKQLTSAFEQLFTQCGLLKSGDKFIWTKEFFPLHLKDSIEDLEEQLRREQD